MKIKYTLPLLLITILAIGGVKAFYWFIEKRIDVDPAPITAAASTEASKALPPDTKATRIDKAADISAITRRDLFASRAGAPARETKISLEEAVPTSLAVVLMGTVNATDGEERAIIYDKKDREQELYQEGDFIQQAAIKEIMRGKVIITLNGRNEILDISEARNVKVPRYEKPAIPKTTSQRVIGRPVGGAAPPDQPQAAADSESPKVVFPNPRTPTQIKSVRRQSN